MSYIDIVFDGPPSHEAGRFVEVHDPSGASISVGQWVQLDNGYWALRISDSPGGRLVMGERLRQVAEEGYTPGYDDRHDRGELRKAAICYIGTVTQADIVSDIVLDDRYPHVVGWPWEPQSWNPSEDSIRNLVKAAALLVAEIDRLLRAQGRDR